MDSPEPQETEPRLHQATNDQLEQPSPSPSGNSSPGSLLDHIVFESPSSSSHSRDLSPEPEEVLQDDDGDSDWVTDDGGSIDADSSSLNDTLTGPLNSIQRSRSGPPSLLSASESSSDNESEHNFESESELEDEFDVATAAARFAVQRRRPTSPNTFVFTDIQPLMSDSQQAFEPDMRRSKQLVDTLEIVPRDLVLRYKRLQGDADDSIICAVCHESLLADNEDAEENISVHVLPCRHLFHTHCISPWLGVKTTCPTCRFDLDPQSLFSPQRSSQGDIEQMLRQVSQVYWFPHLSRPQSTAPEVDDTNGSESGNAASSLPEEHRFPIWSGRHNSSLLTPVSSRAQTLESPVGEQLPFDQIRWPPGRSNSGAQTGAAQPSPVEGNLLDTLLRRRRGEGAFPNSFFSSPPYPSRPLSGLSHQSRWATFPETSDAGVMTQEATPRRSTVSGTDHYQAATDHTPTHASPSLIISDEFSRGSPDVPTPELPPVAPLLGVLNHLPPISPDQYEFPTNYRSSLVEATDEVHHVTSMRRAAMMDWLAPSSGISQNQSPPYHPSESLSLSDDWTEGTSPDLSLDAPRPAGVRSSLNSQGPDSVLQHHSSRHQMWLEALRGTRARVEAAFTTAEDGSSPIPESFTFGGQEHDQSVQSDAYLHNKLTRTGVQSLMEWVEEREQLMESELSTAKENVGTSGQVIAGDDLNEEN